MVAYINNNECEYDNHHENEYEIDYESDTNEDNIYAPEEYSSLSSQYIVLYEPYNHMITGYINNKYDNNLLTIARFKVLDLDYFREYKRNMLLNNFKVLKKKPIHSYIRNYKYLLQTLKPEIGNCYYSSSGECFCILKTVWIKIIQRKWKTVMSMRNNIIKQRSTISSLRYRELNGRWPNHIQNIPTINGMLSGLR